MFVLIISVTQFVWKLNGADEAFLNAPQWITISRGLAVLVFVASIPRRIPIEFQSTETFGVEKWLFYISVYVFIRGVYVEGSSPKLTSYASYMVLAYFILQLKRFRLEADGILIPLRILVYGSLIQLVLFPKLSFVDSPSRFGFFFEFDRFCGLVGHPSLFAFIAFMYLLLVYLLKRKYWKLEMALAIFLLLLANTGSVLICIPLLLFVDHPKSYLIKILRILTVLTPIFSLGLLAKVLGEEVSNSAIMGADALNSRPVIWHWAFELFKQSPLFGLSNELQSYQLGYSRSIYWVHAHNQILQELLMGGALRLIIAGVIFYKLSRMALFKLKRGQSEFCVIYILLLVQSTSEVPFTFNTIDFRFLTFLILVSFYFVDFGALRQKNNPI